MSVPRFAIMSAFLCLNLLLFGALLFETVILYPDMFHDVPRSLLVSDEFMAVTGIGDFMRPVGMATVLVDVAALVAMWRVPSVRKWVAGALLVLVAANFVFSVLYFWPANTVMFTEGPAVHSAQELQEVARGFVAWNLVRIAGCAVAAACAFTGFVRFSEERMRREYVETRTPRTRRTDDAARAVPGAGSLR